MDTGSFIRRLALILGISVGALVLGLNSGHYKLPSQDILKGSRQDIALAMGVLPGIGMPAGAAKAAGGISFIAATAGLNQASNNAICSTPAGAQSGDLLVAFLSNNQTSSYSTLSGWTARLTDTTHNTGISIQTRTHDGSTSSWTFAATGPAATYVGIMIAIRKAAYDTIGSVVSATAPTDPTASAITLSASNSIVIGAYAARSDGNTFTTPSGMTLGAQLTSAGGSTINAVAYYKTGMAAGSSGTFTSHASSGGNTDCVLVGIKPA